MNIVLFTDVTLLGYGKYAGPYRIASELRSSGYSVQVVDHFTRYSTQDFFKILDKFVTDQTLWIGFTTTFNSRGDRDLKKYDYSSLDSVLGREDIPEIVEYAKNINPKIKVVAGGAKARSVASSKIFDHIIVGQGETSTVALTKALVEGEKFPRFASDVEHPYNSFNSSMIEYQPQDIIFQGEHLPIEIARGCIFKCSFCTYPLNGKKMWEYVKQPDVLADEMRRNYDLFKTQGYLVSDDTLNDSVEKVQHLHKSITSLPFDVTLGSYARLDLIVSHPHTLDLMYEMGSRSFFFGIETFNKKSGQSIGKGMDPNKIKQGLEYIKNRYPDILITGGFIFGLPYETKESLTETIEYLRSSPIDHFTISPFQIHADSLIAKDPAKYGFEIKDTRDWSNGHMTYNDAKELTIQALDVLRPRNKLSYWFMHRVMNCGYTLEDCHNKYMTDEVKQEVRVKARQLREEYLTKLLSY